MKPAVLLGVAGELLRELLRFEAPADKALAAFLRQHAGLGSRERHALAETAYELLRRRLLYEHLAQGGSGALERRLAILSWQGGDGMLTGALSPDEQAWRARALAFDAVALAPALRHNLPDWIADPLRAALGDTEVEALAASLLQPAPLDLRVNVLKARREAVREALAALGVASEPTRWSPWGLRVQGKPALTKLEPFVHGEVEVQDEGSQLLALLVGARRGEMVVDFCAGGGGKTLALGAAMRDSGRLYAFDVSGHRLDALKPRLARSGLSNVYAAQIAYERDERVARLAGKVDRVLVDAPCSGLGTLRRNPDLKWRQTPQAVQALNATQRSILASAAWLLKPGGRLVYATCSLLAAENEDIAAEFAAAHPQFAPLDAAQLLAKAEVPAAATLAAGGCLRLWPHRHGTDGFFAAVWQRR